MSSPRYPTSIRPKMPQEFVVIRCSECRMFQVHISKKSNKWICKVCHAKQSVQRIFYHGAAKICRDLVVEANYLQGKLEENHFEITEKVGDILDKIIENGYSISESTKLNSRYSILDVEMESCHLSARKEMLVRKNEDTNDIDTPRIKRTKWDQYC